MNTVSGSIVLGPYIRRHLGDTPMLFDELVVVAAVRLEAALWAIIKVRVFSSAGRAGDSIQWLIGRIGFANVQFGETAAGKNLVVKANKGFWVKAFTMPEQPRGVTDIQRFVCHETGCL